MPVVGRKLEGTFLDYPQEIIYSRIKIQYYRIALACKRVRRRRGKSVAEKIFCSVMSCSADLIL